MVSISYIIYIGHPFERIELLIYKIRFKLKFENMVIEDNERMRRERISEAMKRYYQSDKGLVHRDNVSRSQRLKMSKYGECLKTLNENNEIKTNNNEENKI